MSRQQRPRPLVPLTVQLSPELREALFQFTTARRMTAVDAVRAALHRYIAAEAPELVSEPEPAAPEVVP